MNQRQRKAISRRHITSARTLMRSQIDPGFILCSAPEQDLLLSAVVFHTAIQGSPPAQAVIGAAASCAMLEVTATLLREHAREALLAYEEEIRIIPLSREIAARAGALMTTHGGHTPHTSGLRIYEALLAATALEHDLTLVTPAPFHLMQLPGLKLGYLTAHGMEDLTLRR